MLDIVFNVEIGRLIINLTIKAECRDVSPNPNRDRKQYLTTIRISKNGFKGDSIFKTLINAQSVNDKFIDS